MIISELYIYPIKSLSGISVPEVLVEPRGFRYDRRFMIVSPTGDFMTQRTNHQMALIDVAIGEDTLRVWHRNRPDDALELPLSPAAGDTAETLPVTIWDSKNVPAQPVSSEADNWFSRVLEKPSRLVYMPPATHRPVDSAYARDPANDVVSFADGYPYLLIGQASLDDLNQRAAQPLSMQRFRPNIVVGGSTPYDEDAWAEFRMGNLDFYGVKPCARCVLTTIDPKTALPGKEPLKTLATYRQWKHKILFGQNVLAQSVGDAPIGRLRVGATIEVVRRQEPWLAAPVPIAVHD
ncbi:MOSC domain-containing protein [Spirosoma koreense]